MTDSPTTAPPDLRRWPTDPGQLADTTLCPACFTPLTSARCSQCDLDLAVHEASELLAIGRRITDEEATRQRVISQMRAAQAARAQTLAAAPTIPAVTSIDVVAPPVSLAPPATRAVPLSGVETGTRADVPSPPLPVGEQLPAPGRSGRSGVQVLLLTLGVVLISITAIVFLFVAYLVASLEVRSVIIAAASVLVLAVAWLLRARRLPGTAEGVASVAIVLLLLDVWIVRVNELFGTDRLDAAVYAGGGLLVVAAILAGTRAVSGIRVTGFAAAALIPSAVFLLAFSGAPADEFTTGAWAGTLTASLVGTAAFFAPRMPERAIVAGAGFAAGALALVAAAFALPELAWRHVWTFLAVTGAWAAAYLVSRLRSASVASAWSAVAAATLGVSAGLTAAVAVFVELGSPTALWLAPLTSGVVACAAALWARRPRPVGSDGVRAVVGAGAVATIASIPALFVAVAAVARTLSAGLPPWQHDVLPEFAPAAESVAAVIAAPFVVAAGVFGVLALLRRLPRLAALPTGLLLVAALAAASMAEHAVTAAIVVLAVAVGALAVATSPLARVPGVIPVLAAGGMLGAVLTSTLGYASAALWPWASAAVLVLAIAGRVLAPRIWRRRIAVGAAHVAIASALAMGALVGVVPWLATSDVRLAAPWDAPWMWVATGGAVLLAAGAFVRLANAADRIALALPALLATVISLLSALLAAPEAGWRWVPALVLVVAGLGWMRASNPPPTRIVFAATTPLALGYGLGTFTAQWFGDGAAGVGVAAAALLAAALAHVAAPGARQAPSIIWVIAVAVVGVIALGYAVSATPEPWLVLLILIPVPIVLAALRGDPFRSTDPMRNLAWLSLALAVATVWTWLAGDGVDDVEAYTLPLAVALAATAGLITWRGARSGSTAAGRTALFGAAAAVAVLPSVASSGDSELRTLVLCGAGAVVALASMFLPDTARGVPVRLLGTATGWTAVAGAALVRGGAVAAGIDDGVLPVEFWPLIALATGVVVAVVWARDDTRPGVIAEAMVAASVAIAAVPTLIAIVFGMQSDVRAAVLFPALAAVHIAGGATAARPLAGPIFAWTTRGALVIGGAITLSNGNVDPFDIVTVSAGVAFICWGALSMRRSPELGSWPALGVGLAVLLVPPLIADFTDPELWRIVALGLVSAAAVLIGAMRRLQAPLLFGGAVLLVHAIAQLWPVITWLYEAVWWWLWLGIAGVIFVVLAATYERQLRLARGTIGAIAALR
ncbi:SCO7613 C-terminal domain-containing membrane protein [Agromyces neolithicus]